MEDFTSILSWLQLGQWWFNTNWGWTNGRGWANIFTALILLNLCCFMLDLAFFCWPVDHVAKKTLECFIPSFLDGNFTIAHFFDYLQFGVRKQMRSEMGVSVGLATQKCQLRAFTDFADSLICKKIETCEIGLDCWIQKTVYIRQHLWVEKHQKNIRNFPNWFPKYSINPWGNEDLFWWLIPGIVSGSHPNSNISRSNVGSHWR